MTEPMAQVELGKFHLRVARPSDNLDAVVEFYRDGLGFTVLYEFTDHDGFDGVMLGHLALQRRASPWTAVPEGLIRFAPEGL